MRCPYRDADGFKCLRQTRHDLGSDSIHVVVFVRGMPRKKEWTTRLYSGTRRVGFFNKPFGTPRRPPAVPLERLNDLFTRAFQQRPW